jgi:hypothetical protein
MANRQHVDMEENTGIAVVTGSTKQPVVKVAEGLEVGGFTVRAEMDVPANKYSQDLFLVKIVEPAGLDYLQHEKGSLMEHGRFELDAARDVKVGTKQKISIAPATS